MDFRDTTSMLAQGKDAPENLMARTVAGSRSGVNEYELHAHRREPDFRSIGGDSADFDSSASSASSASSVNRISEERYS